MPHLTWLSREADLRAAKQSRLRVLEKDDGLSYGDDQSTNMVIHGDNLEALKALLPQCSGEAACAYIDPPFNTGQALPGYDDNLEHTLWLSMMYPRLELIHRLLARHGALVVHIDDNELAYLTLLLDELFGRQNRVALVTFKQGSATGHKAINPGMVTITNYLVIYAKSKSNLEARRLFTARNRDDRYNQYIENHEAPYCEWQLMPLQEAFADSRGTSSSELKRTLCARYESDLTTFVIENAERVVQSVRPEYDAVGEDVRQAIDLSRSEPNRVHRHNRVGFPDMYLKDGQRWIFYRDKLRTIDGQVVTAEPLTNLWTDILSNNLHTEGGVRFPKGKKPEALIKRVLELFTKPGDLVIDSFAGSGTTAAVAHKMGRRYIIVEQGEQAVTHCQPRLRRVVDRESTGISRAVGWQGGGGFAFYRLGPCLLDENGQVNRNVSFPDLAAYVWFSATGRSLGPRADSSYLGVNEGIQYYLLYNPGGGDNTPTSILGPAFLRTLPEGPKVIFADSTSIDPIILRQQSITYRQIPYDLRLS